MPVLFCVDDGSSATEFIPCDLATFREAIRRASSDSSPSNSPLQTKKIDETKEEIRRRVAREMSGEAREMIWEASASPTVAANSASSSSATTKKRKETKKEIRARVKRDFAAKKARGNC